MKPVLYALLVVLLYSSHVAIQVVYAAPYDDQLKNFPNYTETDKHCVNYADGTHVCQDMDDVITIKPYVPNAEEVKIETAMNCVNLAVLAQDIQQGRSTEHDSYRDFMAKVPQFLRKNGLPELKIAVITGIALDVFNMPVERNPTKVFESYYDQCAGIDTTVTLPNGMVIEIDQTAAPI